MLAQEILTNGPKIVQKVRDRWKKGERPSGGIIGTYKSFSYEMEKRQRNPLAGGNVDLIDEGDLERGLIVNSLGNSLFTIFSTDQKAVSIAEKYGLEVYGLTPDEELMVLNEAAFRVLKEIFNVVFTV